MTDHAGLNVPPGGEQEFGISIFGTVLFTFRVRNEKGLLRAWLSSDVPSALTAPEVTTLNSGEKATPIGLAKELNKELRHARAECAWNDVEEAWIEITGAKTAVQEPTIPFTSTIIERDNSRHRAVFVAWDDIALGLGRRHARRSAENAEDLDAVHDDDEWVYSAVATSQNRFAWLVRAGGGFLPRTIIADSAGLAFYDPVPLPVMHDVWVAFDNGRVAQVRTRVSTGDGDYTSDLAWECEVPSADADWSDLYLREGTPEMPREAFREFAARVGRIALHPRMRPGRLADFLMYDGVLAEAREAAFAELKGYDGSDSCPFD